MHPLNREPSNRQPIQFMKNKKLIVTLLSTILTIGTAFAQHHETAGITTAPEGESAVVETTEADFQAYNELMRADLRTRRMGFLAAYMDFNGDQSRAFWPIFREYEFESSQLNDGKIALIEDFMLHYDSLTDETARDLAERFSSSRSCALPSCESSLRNSLRRSRR